MEFFDITSTYFEIVNVCTTRKVVESSLRVLVDLQNLNPSCSRKRHAKGPVAKFVTSENGLSETQATASLPVGACPRMRAGSSAMSCS